MTKARVQITNATDARRHEELAAERTSMPYRAPELFNIPSQIEIDERTDVWVSINTDVTIKFSRLLEKLYY